MWDSFAIRWARSARPNQTKWIKTSAREKDEEWERQRQNNDRETCVGGENQATITLISYDTIMLMCLWFRFPRPPVGVAYECVYMCSRILRLMNAHQFDSIFVLSSNRTSCKRRWMNEWKKDHQSHLHLHISDNKCSGANGRSATTRRWLINWNAKRFVDANEKLCVQMTQPYLNCYMKNHRNDKDEVEFGQLAHLMVWMCVVNCVQSAVHRNGGALITAERPETRSSKTKRTTAQAIPEWISVIYMMLVGNTSSSSRMSVGCSGGRVPSTVHSHSHPYSRLFVQDGFSKIKRIVGLAECRVDNPPLS